MKPAIHKPDARHLSAARAISAVENYKFLCTGINFISFGVYSTELWCKKLFTTGYHLLQGKNNLQMEDNITQLATHHSADFYNQINII